MREVKKRFIRFLVYIWKFWLRQWGLSFYGSHKEDEGADTDLMFQSCLPNVWSKKIIVSWIITTRRFCVWFGTQIWYNVSWCYRYFISCVTSFSLIQHDSSELLMRIFLYRLKTNMEFDLATWLNLFCLQILTGF